MYSFHCLKKIIKKNRINDNKYILNHLSTRKLIKKTITTESISKNLYLNHDVINLILENPNYLLNLNINLINMILYQCCSLKKYINNIYKVSLLHNKSNYLNMSTLLLYIKIS